MWETFGPKQESSKALRPFGDAALDGFDFDFEANVQHMAPFANELRSLMKADKSKQKFYLTAAPQCPYPDQADKEILNGPVYIDAIWVQFYNNYCGVNNFNTDSSSSKYNFEEWDNWAKTVSNNKDVKVIVGVPAFTSAASTGYIPASELAKVIEYTKKFKSFGGVMMWDATQAYGNDGFIEDVRKSLGPANDSGSSSLDPVSTSASTSTSTDSTKTTTATTTVTSTTTPSSNAPDSSPSSSSSSSASASQEAAEETTTTKEQKPNPTTFTTTTAKPKSDDTEAKPTLAATTTTTTTAKPKSEDTEAKPTTTAKPKASTTTSAETTTAPTSNASPPDEDQSSEDDSQSSDDNHSSENDTQSNDNNSGGESNDVSDDNTIKSVTGIDLLSLLSGLRDANKAASGLLKNLNSNLQHAQRNRT